MWGSHRAVCSLIWVKNRLKGFFLFVLYIYIFFFSPRVRPELQLLIRFSKFVPWVHWQRETTSVTVEER